MKHDRFVFISARQGLRGLTESRHDNFPLKILSHRDAFDLHLTEWNVPCIGVGTLTWPVSCHAEGKLRERGRQKRLFRDIHHSLTQKAARNVLTQPGN